MELDQAELLKIISSFLDAHKIPHMLTGALSVVYYGRPRASHDIDFVVEIPKADTKKVIEALKKLPTEFLVQELAVEEAIEKRSMFNVIYRPLYLKLDFWLLTNEKFDKERFNRRKRVKLFRSIYVYNDARGYNYSKNDLVQRSKH
jgi:Nucleotidyl transferase AbiEii toxin, Type IV TA system